MRFDKILYERIDYETTKKILEEKIDMMKNTKSFEEFHKFLEEVNNIRKHIMTMETVCQIRFSINTKDDFYFEEKKFWDKYSPLFSDLDMNFYKVILESNYVENLVKIYGKQYINLIETTVKSFSKDIIPMIQEENRLMSKYTALLASASIDFDGKICNLSDISAYMESTDVNIREKAVKLHTDFFEKNEEEFDFIFDELVKLRDLMAKKMGYKNFIELGYLRMNRTEYSPEMISVLRNNVAKKYIPVVKDLYRRQADRIGVNKIDYYNERVEFLDGNAKLIGNADYIIDQGKKMYSEMSTETGEYIEYILKNRLFDVEAREGKAMGGYCTILHDYNDSFIFGNFNGTVDDIDVLTHEAGHGFQVYMSKNQKIPELIFPTLDSCEIFSMTMEFFAYRWMDKFFGDDAEKYKKYHYNSMIKFLPYGVLVDHFQHVIYENPDLTPKERKMEWRRLEKIYLPDKDYRDLSFLENGGFWFRQGHIFKNPFYYIDYVLAELCALQFKELMEKNPKDAWRRYLKISKLGGRCSFLELVKEAELKNPFII